MADKQRNIPKGSIRTAQRHATPAAKPELRKPDEDPVGKVYDSRLIRRLGHYLRPYMWQAIISSVAVSLKSLSDVAGPYLVKVALDRYLPALLNAQTGSPAVSQPIPGWHHPPRGHLPGHAPILLSF